MGKLIQTFVDFYNSPFGRKLVNWGTTMFGLAISSGVIPLDMPVGPFSLGQILTVIGLRMPSVSVQGPVAIVPSTKGT